MKNAQRNLASPRRFSIHHAMVHSARLKVGEHGTVQDAVLHGLSDF